ncbi:hypothetical protein AV656_12175 [Bhargavaea cecembensis]|uniref:Uncharacterized protein n=1 Tax=Bhargavaea cecembensis TaxID=394098 RepID=A0A165GQW8_9BACL|nr:hypothetical protein [Bhargavaea cecembensis]KZE37319.1 hypothetical protein AV656_12175 [Bhargavaea cecembensis]
MNKKIVTGVLLALVFVLLAGCKPSDKYLGEWYAVAQDGSQVKIHFSGDKTMTISDEEGQEKAYEISQTAAGFRNSVGYYRVEVDAQSHYIVFEDRKDDLNAIFVKQTNVASDFEDMVGEVLYSMNRDRFPEQFR